MKKYVTIIGLTLALAASGGCVPPQPKPSEEEKPVELPPQEEEAMPDERQMETKNVTYRGIVQPAGISIYMEGTHRLVLEDGRFILLESEAVDLNGYVDEHVEVFGSVRPTVEGASSIMHVEKMSLIRTENSSSSTEATDGESAQLSSSSGAVENPSVVPPPEEEPTPPSEPEWSPDRAERVAAMAKENMDAANWTQEYCSSHVNFCIPVHRNWWFKSFGVTTSFLWHVEISNEPVLELGNGPIVVNLVSGNLTELSESDGGVRKEGSEVTGFKNWKEDRHFEVKAPAELEVAVRFIIEHLKAQ